MSELHHAAHFALGYRIDNLGSILILVFITLYIMTFLYIETVCIVSRKIEVVLLETSLYIGTNRITS